MDKKKLKETIACLQSNNRKIILETLTEIKYNGISNIIPYIFDLVARDLDENITMECLSILRDIKKLNAVPYYIESLENKTFGDKTADVIACCWQSSLNFSEHLILFAKYFIQYDYQTAIECFSVIEEAIPNADSTIKNNFLNFLKENTPRVVGDKKALYQELIKLTTSYL